MTGAKEKEGKEENVNLDFIIPEEDIKYQDNLFNSLNSNSSVNSQFIKESVEKI